MQCLGAIYEAAIGFKETHEAVVVILPPFAMLHSKRIVDLAAYGLSIGELYPRTAVYMDKILRGQGPEIYRSSSRPSSSSSSIWRAAKQIGLTIPPNVLAKADKVIR